MSEQFIQRKATQYGIKPGSFPTKDDFVKAVEREWDQEIQREARQAAARAKAKDEARRRLDASDWGHDFGPNRKCIKCGLTQLDYRIKNSTHKKVPDDICPGSSESIHTKEG